MNIEVFLTILTVVFGVVTFVMCLFIKEPTKCTKLYAAIVGMLALNLGAIFVLTTCFVKYAEPVDIVEIYSTKSDVQSLDFSRDIVVVDSNSMDVSLDTTWMKVEELPEGVVEKVVASWGFLEREMYIIK